MGSLRGPLGRFEELIGLHQTNGEVYRHHSWKLAVQVGGALWLVGAFAAASVLPVAAPTRHIGDAGWVVTGVIWLAAVAAGIYIIVRPQRVSPEAILAMGYAAVAGLGVGQLLIGPSARFTLPLLLVGTFHAAVHPARRGLPLLAWIIVVAVASTLAGSPEPLDVVQMASGLALLVLLVVMALIHATDYRRLASHLAAMRAEAEERALTDPLTGLPNRRAFEDALARSIAASQRYGRPLSLAMLDVDHFKEINDRLGHDAGDSALSTVAAALARGLRGSDACFRWGGDEFAVLLPETPHDAAEIVVERLREIVGASAQLPDQTPLSISGGVATAAPACGAHDLVALADDELLAHKRSRRDGSPAQAHA